MLRFLLLAGCWLLALTGWAQPQINNWRFGDQAGIYFPGGGPPVGVSGSSLVSFESATSISDENGVLQCYSNGQQVWDRTDQPMPNGTLIGSNESATQGALLVPTPSQPGHYYLFTVDAIEDSLKGGLRYSRVNMALRGGLGDVELPNSVPVPLPGGVLPTEKLTAVLHANGHDYWIVVHGSLDNTFYCYLLTAAGLAATPVVSRAGRTYTDFLRDAPYTMKASPNGRILAACTQFFVEIFSFDNATGAVSFQKQYSPLRTVCYGLEFSPDNSKLYIGQPAGVLVQLDLANNYALYQLNMAQGLALQRGPDGRIYQARSHAYGMAVIDKPNEAGAACNYLPRVPALAAVHNKQALINLPNDFYNPLKLQLAAAGCTNQLIALAASPALATLNYQWDFGDGTPAGTGATLSHRYLQPGRYTVTLTATTPGGGPTTTVQQAVTITPTPTVRLEPRQPLVCGASVVLRASTQPPGTTYRWQDGSTAPTYAAQASGHFRLTVTSAGGCSATDSLDLVLAPPLQVRLPPVPVLCPGAEPLVLRPNAQPDGTTYRWQDGSTNPVYLATQPGRYRLEVRSPAGCTARDSVQVRGPLAADECQPVRIPNIITPNGDLANQTFVLQGYIAADWHLTIFNRWGREVYQREHYDNTWAAEGQAAGIYYYLLRNPDTGRQLKGWVEVIK